MPIKDRPEGAPEMLWQEYCGWVEQGDEEAHVNNTRFIILERLIASDRMVFPPLSVVMCQCEDIAKIQHSACQTSNHCRRPLFSTAG